MLKASLRTDTNVGSSSHNIMGESQERRVLTFLPPASDTVTLSTETPVVSGSGIVLTPGMSPVIIHADIHGELVMREWFAIYATGGSPLSWIESLLCICDDKRYS